MDVRKEHDQMASQVFGFPFVRSSAEKYASNHLALLCVWEHTIRSMKNCISVILIRMMRMIEGKSGHLWVFEGGRMAPSCHGQLSRLMSPPLIFMLLQCGNFPPSSSPPFTLFKMPFQPILMPTIIISLIVIRSYIILNWVQGGERNTWWLGAHRWWWLPMVGHDFNVSPSTHTYTLYTHKRWWSWDSLLCVCVLVLNDFTFHVPFIHSVCWSSAHFFSSSAWSAATGGIVHFPWSKVLP